MSTQVLWSLLAPRLPAMYGSATLAMLVSSTSMNAASATTTAISQGLKLGRHTAGGGKGGTSACAAGSGAFSGISGLSAMGSKPEAHVPRLRGMPLM